MKYMIKVNTSAKSALGYDDLNLAVADFLLTEKRISPDKVISYMKKRIGDKPSKKKQPRPVLCIETGVVYPSRKQVEILFGTGIRKALMNGTKAYGYTWRFAK